MDGWMGRWMKGKKNGRKENELRNWCDTKKMFQELQEQLQGYNGISGGHPDN